MSEERRTNQLTKETSPYLLQHATNPVDWYPWCQEALNLAKQEDKPIFLSIGYSSCHWCHVMARESFENPEIARLMNDLFINIKVDREERPDIDAIYMKAVIEMIGHGGWPMSVFLTPDQRPYFGGTYFPPAPKYNRPGFPEILHQAHRLYLDRRGETLEKAVKILQNLEKKGIYERPAGISGYELIDNAVEFLQEKFDPQFGGFGAGMKFPQAMNHSLLLRHWFRTESSDSIHMVDKSLTKMAEGGMYDQLGGGFHRYSTDRKWQVPHFEKMLYDNALLAKLFLDAAQATKQDIYSKIPREVFSYISREMTSPEGGFYSSQDAETEGSEGAYYVWEMKEVLNLLGPRHAQVLARAYGITSAGNMNRKNVLQIKDSMETISGQENIVIFEVQHILVKGKQILLEAREKRMKPGRDEKILTGWNGLMITALSAGYSVLREKDYLERAERCADFLWREMWNRSGLLRVYMDGKSKFAGCLEDYAYFLEGMIDLYEASFESVWVERAITVADRMIEEFWDEEGSGFFMTGKSHEKLVLRIKNPADEAIPSANAVAVRSLIHLGHLTGKEEYFTRAEKTVEAFQPAMEKSPEAFSGLLSAVDLLRSSPTEIVFSGPKDYPSFEKMIAAVQQDYRPNRILIWNENDRTGDLLPLAEGKSPLKGEPTVYVCHKQTCHPPVQTVEALVKLLGRPPEIRLNIFDEEKKVAEIKTRENTQFLDAMSEIFKHSGLKK